MTDPRDRICERLGALAARVAPDQVHPPDARAWADISAQLDRRSWWRSPRRLVPALVLFAAIAVGSGFLLWPQKPLAYRVQGCTNTAEGAVCKVRGSLAFADGTQVVLEPGALLRVRPFVHGAELSLQDGAASLAVVHRARARWVVLAGPFKVEVTGTRFSVGWQKARQTLDVAVREGEVRVSGGTLLQAKVLQPGQSLRAEARPPEDDVGKTPQVASASAPAGSTAGSASNSAATARTRTVRRPARDRASSSADGSSTRSKDSGNTRLRGDEAVRAASAEPEVTRPTASAPASVPESASHRSWASAQSLGVSSPEPQPSQMPATNQILLGSDGRLLGAMTGRTWLARGEGTKLSSPVLDEDTPLTPQRDGLCASGTVAGLACVNLTPPRCNWDRNWGVVIDFGVRADGLTWGDDAAGAIAVDFHGRSSSYRLTAHKKGDALRKNYCIDNYKSGQMVTPSMFKSRCWDDAGDALPDFKSVDQFGLQFLSRMEYVGFHYCISGIRVGR